ncbi:hypothetical protein [Nocardia testacea]|uniref:hypothetical protein n=1 Tax=Nocardia testacea TaxID=248551 RepID=UPI003A889FCD
MSGQDMTRFLQVPGLDGHPQHGPVVVPGGRRCDIDVETGEPERTRASTRRVTRPAVLVCSATLSTSAIARNGAHFLNYRACLPRW